MQAKAARMRNNSANPAELKLGLGLFGVNVDDASRDRRRAVEIMLPDESWVRARIDAGSPYALADGEDAILRNEDGEYPVRVSPEAEFARRKNARGVALGAIVQVRGLYAVVALDGGCGLSNVGRTCALCLGRELTQRGGEWWPVEEVVEALRAVFDEGAAEFVHFNVGYMPGDDAGVARLRPYIEAVRRYFDVRIGVTMHPPAMLRAIDVSYAMGFDVVCYNFEAATALSLERHFPGRARFLGRRRYLAALGHAAGAAVFTPPRDGPGDERTGVRRRRFGFQARVIITFAVGGALVSAVLAFSTFYFVRRDLVSHRTSDILRQTFANAHLVKVELGAPSAGIGDALSSVATASGTRSFLYSHGLWYSSSASVSGTAIPASLTRVYAVASGKGGVGKSSVTVNLAAALAAAGHKVGLVDADIYGHSVPRMLGVTGRPTAVENMIMPPSSHGVKVMSMGMFTKGNTPVVWRGPMLGKAMDQFLADVYWGDLDYLLLDLPPGTGDVAISLSQMLPNAELLVVTTPQLAAAEVAERAGSLVTQTRQRIAGVIENMSYLLCPHCGEQMDVFGSGGGEAVAGALTQITGASVPLLGQVPLDVRLREGGDNGMPLVLSDSSSPAAIALAKVAETISSKGRGLLGRMLNLSPR